MDVAEHAWSATHPNLLEPLDLTGFNLQKSGVPIADRPSLLLKGSGRMNRILGPDEDLTDVTAKSVRLEKRQRGQ
jgi:hypothetical protein